MLTQGGDCIQICVIVVIQLIFIGFDDSVLNVFLRVIRSDGHISRTGKSDFDHRVANAVSGFDFKATPHNWGVRIAKQDFSSGCTKRSQACWRKSRDFCAA